MGFAVDFRRLVMPRLRSKCRKRAFFVALDMEDFNEACDVVMAEARALGAMHLADDLIGDLDDWIATTILLDMEEFAPAIAAGAAAADQVAADIRRKYFS